MEHRWAVGMGFLLDLRGQKGLSMALSSRPPNWVRRVVLGGEVLWAFGNWLAMSPKWILGIFGKPY